MKNATAYGSPDSITSHLFYKAAGVKGFSAVVTTAGGSYLSTTDAGRIFHGDDLVAKAVAAYGFDVKVHEGPEAGNFNAAYHRRTGNAVPWIASRPIGLPVVG